jgi:hypothetical protein
MYDLDDFGSGNFFPRSFGVASQCIIEMEVDTSKRLLSLPSQRFLWMSDRTDV